MAHTLLLRQGSKNKSWKRVLEKSNINFSELGKSYTFGNTFALIQASKNGLGLCVLPRFCVAEALDDGKLLSVLESNTNIHEVRFELRKIESPQTEYCDLLLREAIVGLKC